MAGAPSASGPSLRAARTNLRAMGEPTTFQALGETLSSVRLPRAAISGRRVLELGGVASSGGRSARYLLDHGATAVTAIDRDLEAIASARAALGSASLTFSADEVRTLERDGFDLVVVDDAATYAPDAATLSALKALLSRDGHLVLVSRRAEGLSLSDLRGAPPEAPVGELTSLARATFRSVETATQTVFFGYSIASGEGAETALDESLADAPSPAYELLLCGLKPTGLNTVSLTPLASTYLEGLQPRTGEAPSAPPSPTSDERGPLHGLAEELEADVRDERVRALEARTQQALEEAERAALATAQALAERDQLKNRLARAETQLEQHLGEVQRLQAADPKRLVELEAKLREAVAGTQTSALELSAARARIDVLDHELAVARERLDAQSAGEQRAIEAQTALRDELSALKAEHGMLRAELEQRASELTATRSELEAASAARAAADRGSAEARAAAEAETSRLSAELARLEGARRTLEATLAERVQELEAVSGRLEHERSARDALASAGDERLGQVEAQLRARNEQLEQVEVEKAGLLGKLPPRSRATRRS